MQNDYSNLMYRNWFKKPPRMQKPLLCGAAGGKARSQPEVLGQHQPHPLQGAQQPLMPE